MKTKAKILENWLNEYGFSINDTLKPEGASVRFVKGIKKALYGAMQEFANEYTQEHTKDCYPKEFVEWLGLETGFGCLDMREMDYKWIYDHKVFTLDELFIYWRDRIKK